ncbi:P pilus assembly protein, chaperone PapD [Sinomicrobium oceani]|uniref:P pilus assembly protein, chaperone PapD n=1 Tax=Sinomicrobium oceani TaxID=1150368 RepID=A0A1K1MRI1_9FLAO|nr:molecular chaperone [Sinomicrobium oceani]SFW25719.1 P pilus assembly protein, chaperone PapD [Sinomicrobium oceani]
MKMKIGIRCVLLLLAVSLRAQTGISVSPPRIYFQGSPGESKTETVVITNASTKNRLDLSVGLGDWGYSFTGENMMYPADSLSTSCAGWVSIGKDDAYFSLNPGEKREIDISINPPETASDSIPVRTAMLYVTQMNPVDDVDDKGGRIKVSVRSGIKLYYRNEGPKQKRLEIYDMKYVKEEKMIHLFFENTGNIWTDGIAYTDLVNTSNGQKRTLDHLVFYTLPGNRRELLISLPDMLENGKYVASVIVDYGDDNALEMAELTFTYE